MAKKNVRLYDVYYCNVDGLKKCNFKLSYIESVEYADRIWYLWYNLEYINWVYILWKFKNG